MSASWKEEASDLADLVALVRRLRAPDGCPWDQKQTLETIRAYLLEEAHELAAAIDAGNMSSVREELGDLLFQTAFVGCLAEEAEAFEIGDAIQDIRDKMVERHPHVFPPAGDEAAARPRNAKEVVAAWESRKAAQRGEESLLSGLPTSLPALTGAYRLTQKAAGVGFDWPDVQGVIDKVKEELAEVEAALAARAAAADPVASPAAASGTEEALREELGDLLFSVANLARHLKVDPEAALARGNLKFRRRFGALETVFRERGTPLADAGLEALDEVWERVKSEEAKNP